MNFKQQSSPSEPLLYNTQLPILTQNTYQQISLHMHKIKYISKRSVKLLCTNHRSGYTLPDTKYGLLFFCKYICNPDKISSPNMFPALLKVAVSQICFCEKSPLTILNRKFEYVVYCPYSHQPRIFFTMIVYHVTKPSGKRG